MPKLGIIRLGHPILRTKSTSVTKRELDTPKFQTFLDDLVTTCRHSKGVGIAAPQVGVNQRVIVVYVNPKNPRYPDRAAFPLTIVINPRITSHSRELIQDWEGDLSTGLRALVPRWSACTVTGLDRHGQPFQVSLTNPFHARVFQHEIDHLNGKLYLDRVTRKDSFSEQAEWEQYWKDQPID